MKLGGDDRTLDPWDGMIGCGEEIGGDGYISAESVLAYFATVCHFRSGSSLPLPLRHVFPSAFFGQLWHRVLFIAVND